VAYSAQWLLQPCCWFLSVGQGLLLDGMLGISGTFTSCWVLQAEHNVLMHLPMLGVTGVFGGAIAACTSSSTSFTGAGVHETRILSRLKLARKRDVTTCGRHGYFGRLIFRSLLPTAQLHFLLAPAGGGHLVSGPGVASFFVQPQRPQLTTTRAGSPRPGDTPGDVLKPGWLGIRGVHERT